MKNYHVESGLGWMIVRTRTKREARSEGVREFGRGNVREVREATSEETAYYEEIKGPLTPP